VEAASAATASESYPSSYRLKFRREQFMELVQVARPKILYKRKNIYLFAYDGFVMYTSECSDEDFQVRGIKVLMALEFSNYPWQK